MPYLTDQRVRIWSVESSFNKGPVPIFLMSAVLDVSWEMRRLSSVFVKRWAVFSFQWLLWLDHTGGLSTHLTSKHLNTILSNASFFYIFYIRPVPDQASSTQKLFTAELYDILHENFHIPRKSSFIILIFAIDPNWRTIWQVSSDVHGEAGSYFQDKYFGMKVAVRASHKVLKKSGSILDAVEAERLASRFGVEPVEEDWLVTQGPVGGVP